MSHEIPSRFSRKEISSDVVLLNNDEMENVRLEIIELTAYCGDRIIGGMPLLAMSVSETTVQIVTKSPEDSLNQRIGRLKSRLATLLSFHPKNQSGGKNTWSKGFFSAKINTAEAEESVLKYVRANIN